MARPAIVIALPPDEASPVATELREAGFDVDHGHRSPTSSRRCSRAAATSPSRSSTARPTSTSRSSTTASCARPAAAIPALMVVSPRALDQLVADPTASSVEDEYFTRPYSAESLRWRVEAMCIRSQTVDDGSGPVLQGGPIECRRWSAPRDGHRGLQPEGRRRQDDVATNLASALQVRKGQNVLLIDADTVTGHVTTSLGIEAVRTVVDSWRDQAEGGPLETLDRARRGPSLRAAGRVADLVPAHTEILEPARVADAIASARRGFDFVVVDLHPSYSPLNQAIFEKADRILVPVTPDVPAIRAAVQLRDVACELGLRDRLALVINRANSGVSVADMERTVGMPALALIRSGGLLFVRAANEGRTVIEMFPQGEDQPRTSTPSPTASSGRRAPTTDPEGRASALLQTARRRRPSLSAAASAERCQRRRSLRRSRSSRPPGRVPRPAGSRPTARGAGIRDHPASAAGRRRCRPGRRRRRWPPA